MTSRTSEAQGQQREKHLRARAVPLGRRHVWRNRLVAAGLLLFTWWWAASPPQVAEPHRLWKEGAWCDILDERPCVERYRGSLHWQGLRRKRGGHRWSFRSDDGWTRRSLVLRAGRSAADLDGPVTLVVHDGAPLGVVGASGKRWHDSRFAESLLTTHRQAVVTIGVGGLNALVLAEFYRWLVVRRPGIVWGSGEAQAVRWVVVVWWLGVLPGFVLTARGLLPGWLSWVGFVLGTLPYVAMVVLVAVPRHRRSIVALARLMEPPLVTAQPVRPS